MHEHQIRKELIRFGQLCYERNLLVAMDGNLSAMLPSGDIVCTKAGCHKGFLTDDDLVVINRRGELVRGSGRPTSEMAMHLACYAARPDVKAVIHTHPPLSIAFTIAGVSMARCVLPEVVLTLGVIPTVEYATTGTDDLARRVGEAVAHHDAILMDRHGAVCVGTSLLEAFCRLETMEHTALITKTARDLGGVRDLPPEEAVRLRAMGLKRYGGPPAAVAQADAPGADLPAVCTGCSGCATPTPAGIAPRADLQLARMATGPVHTLATALGNLSASKASAPAADAALEARVAEEVARILTAQR